MQGARGWRRWCCRAPGNEPHDSPLSNEKVRHLREAVFLTLQSACLCVTHSLDSFDPFNFFNSDIFDLGQRSPENSATYGPAGLVWALPLYSLLRARAQKLLEAIIVRSLLVYLLHFMVFLSLARRNGSVRRNSRR